MGCMYSAQETAVWGMVLFFCRDWLISDFFAGAGKSVLWYIIDNVMVFYLV